MTDPFTLLLVLLAGLLVGFALGRTVEHQRVRAAAEAKAAHYLDLLTDPPFPRCPHCCNRDPSGGEFHCNVCGRTSWMVDAIKRANRYCLDLETMTPADAAAPLTPPESWCESITPDMVEAIERLPHADLSSVLPRPHPRRSYPPQTCTLSTPPQEMPVYKLATPVHDPQHPKMPLPYQRKRQPVGFKLDTKA